MQTIRALALLVLTASAAGAQTNPSSTAPHPLEGVWSRVAGVTNGEVVANQPGYRMFVEGHYSVVRVEGVTPRQPAPATGATAAQVRAALQPFTGQAGSFEVTSMQTVLHRPAVAYVPANMGPDRYGVSTYRVRGDTMWYTGVHTQNGPVPNPSTEKFVRVRNGGPTALDGVWRLTEGRSADGTLQDDQPGYRIFKDGHFSLVRVNGTVPRPQLPGADATAEQLLAAWGPFTAFHGTFEVAGQTIIDRQLVGKAPQAMAAGGVATRRFRITGDTLWITQTAGPNGPAADAPTFRYVRVRAQRPPTE